MRVPPISSVAPFPTASSRGGILSLRGRERIPSIPVASQEEALSTGKTRGTPGSGPIPRVPLISQAIAGKPVFPALPRLSREDRLTPRWHVGQPCGEASWESPVGKPRGKAPDPLIHAKGSVTLLLRSGGKRTCIPPLETTTDSPRETPEVPQDPSQHLRGMLRFRHLLHTRS